MSAYALTLDDPMPRASPGRSATTCPRGRAPAAGARPRSASRTTTGAAAQYAHAVERLGAAGFRGYEISNWGRPGHESRHNLVYWQRRPYEAVGPGAHAFDGARRRWNAARLDGYLRALAPADGAAPTLPPGGEEAVDAETAAAEAVILALRLDTA